MPTIPPQDAPRGAGLGTVIVAAALGAAMTVVVIWYHGLSFLWAIVLYPAIGATLTFALAGLSVLRIKGAKPAPEPKPQSSQAPLRSHVQKPPH